MNLRCTFTAFVTRAHEMRSTLSPLHRFAAALIAFSILSTSPVVSQDDDNVRDVRSIKGLPSKIAFGSCAHQDKPQPILETIVGKQPDLFVYLGDNIYGDSRDMDVLRRKYAKLGGKPEFKQLRQNVPVLSVWDDHDYGENDAGKEYPGKEASRLIFFDFWKVPKDSDRRQHPGIYGAHRFEADGRTLQVILLDTRTFRDPLRRNKRSDPDRKDFKNDYRPDPNPEKTFLGDQQWNWLEQQLEKPADLRIICSSIQFGHEYNGWESWTNLPAQQQKMFDLINETKANGVMFVSGDVHWGEISVRQPSDGYPIYDVTASGITETWPTVEPNRHRVGEVVRDNHFGMISVNWQLAAPAIQLQIVDKSGRVRQQKEVRLSELDFDE